MTLGARPDARICLAYLSTRQDLILGTKNTPGAAETVV